MKRYRKLFQIQASLGKLCALAAEEEREGHKQVCENLIENANCRLLLAEHHNLPPQLLSAYGLEPENLRVLEAREIIDVKYYLSFYLLLKHA